MTYTIAIDGPAGAGKSTIAKSLAKRLNFIYVDTGAMYRAMALYYIREGVSPEDAKRVEELCENVDVSIDYIDGEQQVLLNNENVNSYIRTEEVGKMASAVSVYKFVRIKLVELQRKLASKANVIMDGREIGTYVLPNAFAKIYLTASSKERAKRRYIELTEKGIVCDIDEIEKDIIDRDHNDMTREFAPLKQASDAVLVDTSQMSVEEVIDKLYNIFEETKEKINES